MVCGVSKSWIFNSTRSLTRSQSLAGPVEAHDFIKVFLDGHDFSAIKITDWGGGSAKFNI